jgi:hypothetical protein
MNEIATVVSAPEGYAQPFMYVVERDGKQYDLFGEKPDIYDADEWTAVKDHQCYEAWQDIIDTEEPCFWFKGRCCSIAYATSEDHRTYKEFYPVEFGKFPRDAWEWLYTQLTAWKKNLK